MEQKGMRLTYDATLLALQVLLVPQNLVQLVLRWFQLVLLLTLVVTGVHWTGSPNKSIDQIGKNCPKNVRKLCFQPLWTIFGHFSDIFLTFSDISSTFPFSGLSNDLPITRPWGHIFLLSFHFDRRL